MDLKTLLHKLELFMMVYLGKKEFNGELKMSIHVSQGGISKVKFGAEKIEVVK